MRIEIGEKYYLNCDQFCYWISLRYEIKSGKGAGETIERRVSGYTATFEQAVDSFIERHIKTAKIGDFSELVREVNDLKEEVRSWKVDLERTKL